MKAIFLDRDGVINKDPGGWTKYNYVTNTEELIILPGVFEALSLLKRKGMKAIIISNQAGVSKGYFTEDDLSALDRKISKMIKDKGGRIEESYYCIHRDEDNCDCRKPKSGLLEKAAKKHGIDLKTTYFIGDTRADVSAGKKAGCKTVVVLSGKTSLGDIDKWDEKPDYVFKDLLEAVRWIIKEEGGR